MNLPLTKVLLNERIHGPTPADVKAQTSTIYNVSGMS